MSTEEVLDIRDKKGGAAVDRSSTPELKKQLHYLAAGLIRDLKKEMQYMTVSEKTNLLGKTLAYIADDEGKSMEDASFDVQAEKYLKIEMKIKGVGNTTSK